MIVFCGLRPTEAQRLKWEHITFDKVRGSKVHIGETKTDYSRMVDLCPCAVAWLETARERTGKPSPFSHVIPARDDDDTETGESARKCAWRALVDAIKTNCPPALRPAHTANAETWPRDLLRHSFDTCYRAMTESLAKTADQMGNSEKICREHYSRPVLQAEGEAYLNIWPEGTKHH